MKNTLKLMGLSGAALMPLVFSSGASAAGFMLNEHGVAGLGRSYAGETAVGDNASVIARNPAAMSLFKKKSLSAAVHYIDPEIDVKGTNTNVLSTASTDASKKDVAPSAVVPGFYYVSPVNDTFAWGLALNSNFGLSTDYGSSYAATEFAQKTSVETMNITPSISVKFSEQFSFGLGVSYIHGEGEIKNSASATVAVVPEGRNLVSLDGDGDRCGWNVGLLWNIDEQSRLGFRYQAAVDLVMKGDIKHLKAAPAGGTGTLTVNLPEIYEVGYFRQLDDDWAIMASVQNNRWSSFQTLTADIQGYGEEELKPEHWSDTWSYSIGTEYELNDTVKLRAGYAFDESPVSDEHRTLTIPDADRTWYTLGATFDMKSDGSIDVAVLYIDGDNVDVEEVFEADLGMGDQPVTSFSGELESVGVWVYSVGYNYSY